MITLETLKTIITLETLRTHIKVEIQLNVKTKCQKTIIIVFKCFMVSQAPEFVPS